ncbi:HMW kininogen [Neofusicoccum parvum]|uniref:HMW kininogen n=1 Tax=Neofusicoccum parvum TaxID=310453 RepID=A0ACB5RUR7_9PEZI|nr:HMW kininogen [Neofusicoccum parvum]
MIVIVIVTVIVAVIMTMVMAVAVVVTMAVAVGMAMVMRVRVVMIVIMIVPVAMAVAVAVVMSVSAIMSVCMIMGMAVGSLVGGANVFDPEAWGAVADDSANGIEIPKDVLQCIFGLLVVTEQQPHTSTKAQSICQNVQEDALHVLVAMVVVVVATMSMCVSVTHRSETDNVDYQAKHTNDQELVEAAKLMAFPNALERI